MHNILKKIVEYKGQELEHQRRKVSLQDVRKMAEDVEPARDFLGALSISRRGVLASFAEVATKAEQYAPTDVRIIAEVKKASPSAGIIRPDFNPVNIAQIYEENGASCLSVLTDEHFFQGNLKYLESIRSAVKIPLLRKDFTLDAYHLYEARAHGADAVLLIVRILEENQIRDYIALTHELGMSALIEVHDASEMTTATKVGANLIGINNRDLQTFKVNLDTSITLSKQAPKETLLVSESGISTREHIEELLHAGVHSFLIGEALLREKDPGKKLRELIAG